MAERSAEEIFKEFKEHSIAEFFKKNRQMLGYSGMVRSLTTVVHEYVTNSLDACEEANVLPDIEVEITATGENKYKVRVRDNGPGIPKKFVGKALATILAGTKFHRYVQQRGQQGIGASGCTLFAQMTTGKAVGVKSHAGKGMAYRCSVGLNTVKNTPQVDDMEDLAEDFKGLEIEAEFGEVKYENSDHSVYEYLKRTALANPHAQIRLVDPTGKEHLFIRASTKMPEHSKPTLPHPLGLSVNDLLEFAHLSESRKLTSFFVDTFARTTPNKVSEIREIAKSVDLDKSPRELTWAEAEELIKAIRQVKWIAPDASAIIPIGEEQVKKALANILNPEFMNVVERKPQVFRGGIPFVVECAVAYGGKSGYANEDGHSGVVLRFANRVPLLFDAGNCAIAEAVKNIQWKRYNIDLDTQPVSVFVEISSVHVPYAGVGKEAIAKEDEIIEEIKLAVMEAARGVQHFIRGKERTTFEASRYKAMMRYVKQVSGDIAALSGEDQKKLEADLERLVAEHYPKAGQVQDGSGSEESAAEAEAGGEEEDEAVGEKE
jgi:DNA topoisomerase-6 subunit B